MIEPSELDLAQLRHEMRVLYGHMGFEGCLQIVYDMTIGANMLLEIIMEEMGGR